MSSRKEYKRLAAQYPDYIIVFKEDDVYYRTFDDSARLISIITGETAYVTPSGEVGISFKEDCYPNGVSSLFEAFCPTNGCYLIKKDFQKPAPSRKKIKDEYILPDTDSFVLGVGASKNNSDPIPYMFVVNDKKQDTSKNIYFIDRTITKKFLTAIVTENYEFTYKGDNYKIDPELIIFISEEFKAHLFHFYTLDNSDAQTIYVQKSSHILHYSNKYIPCAALVKCMKSSLPAIMLVYYSLQDKKYFISYESYETYRNKYGLPYLKLESIPSNYDDGFFESLKDKSPLKLYGYDVSKETGLTREERKAILTGIIDSKLMSKEQVISYLEFFLRRFKNFPNFQDALVEWQHDLQFISDYNLDMSNIVWANGFQLKS